MRNPQSTAKIAGHPLHPMLIPLPVTFFLATFASDLAFWRTNDTFWFDATLWLLGAGIVTALIAAVPGSIDAFGDKHVTALKDVWWHAGGNMAVVALQAYNWFIRYNEGASSVIWEGLILSAVSAAILGITAWLGGTLVYRHRVGVQDYGSTHEDDFVVRPRQDDASRQPAE